MEEREFRTTFTILLTETGETLVEEGDPAVTSERARAVEPRIENEDGLNRGFAFASERGGSVERGIVPNPEVRAVPDQDRPVVRRHDDRGMLAPNRTGPCRTWTGSVDEGNSGMRSEAPDRSM